MVSNTAIKTSDQFGQPDALILVSNGVNGFTVISRDGSVNDNQPQVDGGVYC